MQQAHELKLIIGIELSGINTPSRQRIEVKLRLNDNFSYHKCAQWLHAVKVN